MTNSFDKRREQAARELASALFTYPNVLAEHVELITSAFAAREADLVARMMEPSAEMIEAATSAPDGMFETTFRAMLTAFCEESGIPLPSRENAEVGDG